MAIVVPGNCSCFLQKTPIDNNCPSQPLPQILVQAQQYAALRKPYLINDILESNTLLDRRRVYQRLQVPLCFTTGKRQIWTAYQMF